MFCPRYQQMSYPTNETDVDFFVFRTLKIDENMIKHISRGVKE